MNSEKQAQDSSPVSIPQRASKEIRDQYPSYAYHEMPGDDGSDGSYPNDGMVFAGEAG